MHYTDLVFDLYGTLVDIHTEENEEAWEKTALYFGFYGGHCTGPELQQAFQEVMRAREAQAGQSYECFPDIPFEEVFAHLFRQMGATDRAEELGVNASQFFRIQSICYIRRYPYVLEALERLRARGCRLWLLSNAQRIFTEYELRHLGLLDAFDGIYISSDYRCRKPDSRFYQALLREQRLDPARCLMIGNDRKTDIAGAELAGMGTLYLHTGLTPRDQAPADPALSPALLGPGRRTYEYEGDDWSALIRILEEL